MSQRDTRKTRLRALAEPIERLAQANIALVLAQAVIVILSVEMTQTTAPRPDPLVLIGFLTTCLVAAALVVVLHRTIKRFPHRWLRIAIALGTVLLQAGAFQLIHAYVS